MHGLPVIVPVPELVKLTAPNGADFEPESVSDTFAVHVVVSSSGNDAGAQPVTLVDVDLVVTEMSFVPELVECELSPP